MASIDHLVVAGTDLTALVAWWHRAAGRPPHAGGAHIGLGTRNALVGLGPTTYLELIGPDPDQPDPSDQRPFGIDGLEPNSIRLVTYAVAVDALDDAIGMAADAEIDFGPARVMSRERPDGSVLSWRLALPLDDVGGTVPFLIEWGDADHPASVLGSEATLESLAITTPDAEPVRTFIGALGLDLMIDDDDDTGVAAIITTTHGRIEL